MEEDIRSSMQQEAVENYLKSSRKNTIIIGTGGGKSRCALKIIKELNPTNILLLTNATTLRDVNWKNEFDKFDMLEEWDRVTSECYQTVYKWRDTQWDLVIADEIDASLTPSYSEFYGNNKYTNLLGLTGFITEEKRGLLQLYAPVCYEVSAQELQEDNLLNKSEFIFIEFPLSKEKTIEQKLKKGGTFKVSENDQYVYWDKKFQQAMMVKSALYKKYRQQLEEPEGKKDYMAADWNFKLTATKRKNILHNLDSSVKVVYELLRHIHSTEGNKVIIFSANTKQSGKFPNPFNSKEEVASIQDLNEGKVNTLSVVKKITRGVNLIGVNYLIRESFDSSEEMFHQSLGRLLRLKPDQVAKYIILIPYYTAQARELDGVFRTNLFPTQAAKWTEKMIQSSENIKPRYIKLDSMYKINEGVVI